MKKNIQIILAFLTVISVVFTGCEKDDKDSNSIIGKWEGESYSYKYWENDVLKGSESETAEPNELIVEFKTNGTYVATSQDEEGSVTETGAYTINGNKLTFIDDEEKEEDISEFSISNNKLSLIQKDEETIDNVKYRWEDVFVLKRIK